jgi:predicted GH43/DUF377 family glycosyl hydrolase
MLRRYENNPILKPIKEHPWESKMVFNCACVYDNGVHIVYRAIGEDNKSSFGYAFSGDGFKIDKRLPFPIYTPVEKFESHGCEDPRITLLNDCYYLVYAGYDGKEAHVALASIRKEDFLRQNWNWTRHGEVFPEPVVPGKDNKNACLFPEKIQGRYVLYHRVPPDIWVSYSYNLRDWFDHKIVARPRHHCWDEAKIGIAGPPIKTDKGWLLIYHGVAWANRSQRKFGKYRLGCMLIKSDNPEEVLARSKEPILEPEKEYEEQGVVANVVFSCGQVLRGDELFLYYGGADTVICVARGSISELLTFLEK